MHIYCTCVWADFPGFHAKLHKPHLSKASRGDAPEAVCIG